MPERTRFFWLQRLFQRFRHRQKKQPKTQRRAMLMEPLETRHLLAAPDLHPIPAQTVTITQPLTFTATAIDTDIPR